MDEETMTAPPETEGPQLCINGHLAVVHSNHREGTPLWCNEPECEYFWGKQAVHEETAPVQ